MAGGSRILQEQRHVGAQREDVDDEGKLLGQEDDLS
jgi:hypothetical protein